MSSTFVLIAWREIVQRVRRRSFIVTTIGLCVLIVGAGVLVAVLRDDSRPERDVGVVATSPAQPLDTALVAVGDALGIEVTVHHVDAAKAAADLEHGDLDAVIDVERRTVGWQHAVDPELSTVVDGAWRSWSALQTALDAGLDEATIGAILTPQPLSDEIADSDEDEMVGTAVGMIAAVLLFIAITTYGGLVLTGVVEEKSTGVVEVLLSYVGARDLVRGKVVGIGFVALIQFCVAIIAGMVSLLISGIDVPRDVFAGLPVTIAWFVGGFLLYSTLFALAGSLVSRTEDAQVAAAPVTTAVTVGYLLVFTVGSDPSALVTRILSLLPPFAPLLMPLRIVSGSASMIEIAVAAVGLAAAVWAMLQLTGTVYARTLLHRGRRLTWRQGLRS